MGGHADNCVCPNCDNNKAMEYVDTTIPEIDRWCDHCGWHFHQTGYYKGPGRNNPKLVSTVESVDKDRLYDFLDKTFIFFPFEMLLKENKQSKIDDFQEVDLE